MLAKLLEVIVDQPTTKSMDRMTEHMAQMVAPVKTTPWGGLHESLALVLDDADHATVTKNIITSSAPFVEPTTINPKINKQSNPYEILTLQEEMKTLQKEFKLQEAVATIRVQHIIDSVEEWYIKELNKEYFGYPNQTIKMLLVHLHTNWCKVMTKERTDATEAIYQSWVLLTTHIITLAVSSTSSKRSARPSMSSSWRKPKCSTLSDKCTRAATTRKSK